MAEAVTLSQKVTRLIKKIEDCWFLEARRNYLDFLVFLLEDDENLIADFFPRLLSLVSTCHNIRDEIVCMLGEKIAVQNLEYVHKIVPLYISLMRDNSFDITSSAVFLFRDIFKKIAIEALHCGDPMDTTIVSSLRLLQSLKDTLCTSLQDKDYIMLELDLVRETILLYTPNASGSLVPPPHLPAREMLEGFNIAWFSGSHPVFDVVCLYGEACKLVDGLINELMYPDAKGASYIGRVISVLSVVAKERPAAFYGKIVKVLVDFDPTRHFMLGTDRYDLHVILSDTFDGCLELDNNHLDAATIQWRNRLIEARKKILDRPEFICRLSSLMIIKGSTGGTVQPNSSGSGTTKGKNKIQPPDDASSKDGDGTEAKGKKRIQPESDDASKGVSIKRAKSALLSILMSHVIVREPVGWA